MAYMIQDINIFNCIHISVNVILIYCCLTIVLNHMFPVCTLGGMFVYSM